ncbi:MAG: 30S ribosomal protein S17e [Thaumarchaeota archaeon]|nr:30S ribosomal protein S17e [Candidatus Calditenuaceae archaeon]MDW8041958.1 30S ribosomal protein S17e [Nitrososphaerota archaeon]
MGKIRTAKVKRTAKEIVETFGARISTSFEENKALVGQVLEGRVSKKFRNKVAGYLTRLARLSAKGGAGEAGQVQ